MRLISTLKRAKYVGAAMVLLLATMPVLPIRKAWADAGDLASCLSSTESTCTLHSDETMSGLFTLDRDLTINLNGYKISSSSTAKFFEVKGHTLNIVGPGSIVTTNTENTGIIRVLGTDTADSGSTGVTVGQNVTLSGPNPIVVYNNNGTAYNTQIDVYGTLNGQNAGIWMIGTIANKVNYPVVNIHDGAVISANNTDSVAVSAMGYAEWNIGAATITGTGSGIGIKAGIVNIEGATVKGTGNPAILPPATYNNGINPSGAAIQIEKNAGYAGGVELNISSGTFTSDYNDAVYIYGPAESAIDSIEISGGTFSDPNMLPTELEEGKVIYKVGSNYIVDDAPDMSAVKKDRAVLKVGTPTVIAGLAGNKAVETYGSYTADNGTTFDTTTGEATAASYGVSTLNITFDIYKNEGGVVSQDTSYNKTIKLHAYDYTTLGNVYVGKGAKIQKDANVQLNANRDSYEFSTADESIATIDPQTGEVTGVGYGETAIKLKVFITAHPKVAAEETIGTVYVHDFETTGETRYDIGQGDTVELKVSEAYDQDAVSCKIGDDDCDGDVFSVSKDAEGNYTITARDDAVADKYVLTFTDEIGGQVVATHEVTIRIHEVIVEDENGNPVENVYTKKGEQIDLSVYEVNNRGRIGWVVRDDGGSTVHGVVNLTKNGNNITGTSNKVGDYEIEFQNCNNKISHNCVSDVLASKTVQLRVYGLDAEVEDSVVNLNSADKATYKWTIDPSETYGSVRTTITRRSPTSGRERQVYRVEKRYDGTGTELEEYSFDPTQYGGEGTYTIRIENRSVGRHGLSELVEEATFQVIAKEYDVMVVKQGDVVEIESGSEWRVTSAYANDDRLQVEDNKKVTIDTADLDLGITTVNMYHRFSRSQREAVKTVTLVVYKVVPDPKTDPNGVTKDTVEDLIDTMTGSVIDDASLAKIRAILGENWFLPALNLSSAMSDGLEINTRVAVTDLDESAVSEEMINTVAALGTDHVDYYDVSVLMEAGGVEIGKLHKLNGKITVALAEVTDPATGYSRQYFVIREHDGTITVLEEGVDFYIENGVLYAIADEFSTYAVAYKDTLIPKAPDTGDETMTDDSTATMSVGVAMVLALAAITVAGAVVVAKRK